MLLHSHEMVFINFIPEPSDLVCCILVTVKWLCLTARNLFGFHYVKFMLIVISSAFKV